MSMYHLVADAALTRMQTSATIWEGAQHVTLFHGDIFPNILGMPKPARDSGVEIMARSCLARSVFKNTFTNLRRFPKGRNMIGG